MTRRLAGRRIEPSVHGPAQGAGMPAELGQPGPVASEMAAVPVVSDTGRAFAVEDLVMVRDWAERRGLRLIVQLDHAECGILYEEMLSLTPRGHSIRCLTLWREGEAVALRTAIGNGRLHHTVGEALQHWEREGGGRKLRLSAWIGPLLTLRRRRAG